MNNYAEFHKLTVRMAMTLPELCKLKLISGESGLDKVIEHVTAFEIGAIPFFSGGEFVLSGGRTFPKDFTSQAATVKQLANKGIAALAIKKTDNIYSLPRCIIKECKKLSLPLFEIDPFATYRPIMQAIMKKIFDMKTIEWVTEMNDLLRFEDNTDIERLCNWIETKSFQPCIIIDGNDNMYGGSNGKIYIDDIQMKTQYLGSVRQRFGNIEFTFEHAGETRIATTFWIHTEREEMCLILVVEQTDKSTDASIGYMGASLLAHLLEERESLYQSEAVKLLQYFQVIKEPLEVISLEAKKQFRLNLDQPLRMVIAKCNETRCDEIYHYWRGVNTQSLFYKLAEDTLLGIIPEKFPAKSLISILPNNFSPIWLGIGRAYGNPNKLFESFQEAKIAIKVISNNSSGGVVEFEKLGMLRLISELKNSEIMHHFRESYLDPIIRYDKKNQTELLKTLQVYYGCNRSIKRTSESLFVGKTTLVYRLKKIESITGVTLACSGDGIALQIAALSEEILENHP